MRFVIIIPTLLRQSRLSFDTCWLENIGEKIVLETVGNRVTPLVLNPGRVLLTNERLYFQPYNNVEMEPVTKVGGYWWCVCDYNATHAGEAG